MASEDRSVKDKQLEKAVKTFEAYKAKLTEKGLDEKASLKDPKFRALKASVKKARSRIRSIEAADAHVKEVAAKTVKGKTKKGDKAKKAKMAESAKKQAKPPKKKK